MKQLLLLESISFKAEVAVEENMRKSLESIKCEVDALPTLIPFAPLLPLLVLLL